MRLLLVLVATSTAAQLRVLVLEKKRRIVYGVAFMPRPLALANGKKRETDSDEDAAKHVVVLFVDQFPGLDAIEFTNSSENRSKPAYVPLRMLESVLRSVAG